MPTRANGSNLTSNDFVVYKTSLEYLSKIQILPIVAATNYGRYRTGMFAWLKRLLGGSPNRTQERKLPPLLRMPDDDDLDYLGEHVVVPDGPTAICMERVVEVSSGEQAENHAKVAEFHPRAGMVFGTVPASLTFTDAIEPIAEPMAGLREDKFEGDPVGEKSWSAVEIEGGTQSKLGFEPTHSTVCQKQLETDSEHFPVSTFQMQPGHVSSAVTLNAVPAWFQLIPSRVFFFDVETTGLHKMDRIVSFAGILLDTSTLLNKQIGARIVQTVCDPGKRSHPQAEKVHGYDDWTLRHQTPFCDSADIILDFLNEADLIVSHNIDFDRSFLIREFYAAGRTFIPKKEYCTMQAHRQFGFGGRSSLNAVASRIGYFRSEQRHGALEDAYLAMMIYLKYNRVPYRFSSFNEILTKNPNLAPKLDPVPPRPDGLLPRRKLGKVPRLITKL